MARLFRIHFPGRVLVSLSVETILTSAVFWTALYLHLGYDPAIYLLYENGLIGIGVVIVSILLAMYFLDLYTHIVVRSRIDLAQQLSFVLGIAFVAEAFVSYLKRDLGLPASAMLLGCAFWVVVVFPWRVLYSSYLLKAVGAESVLFLGVTPLVLEVSRQIQTTPQLGLRILGYLCDTAPDTEPEASQWLGPIRALKEVVGAAEPSRIVVGLTQQRGQMPAAELLDLSFAGYGIEHVSTTYENVCKRISISSLRPSDLIFAERLGPRRGSMFWHSLVDISVALLATLLLGPLMIVIALAVKLTSPGPVFYRQKRVGLNSKVFDVLKFRTMTDVPLPPADGPWDPNNDPRVTTIGKWVRKLRLNELPQLFNVLRREMSIVGPRPERAEYVAVFSEIIPFYRRRHSVPPGITGWAQINCGHGDTPEDTRVKLEYDLYYIKHMSQSLDLFIMFQTVKTVLLARDAG